MVQVAHFFATLSFLLITPSVVNAVSVNVVAPAKGVAISPASELFATVTRRADTDFVAPLPPPFPHADAPKKRGTNSERFARGLSPLKPTRRYTGPRVARAVPSGVPLTAYRGYIHVLDTADTILGYISKNSLSAAQLRYETDVEDALIVDFSVPTSATTTTEVEISTENQDTGFSLLSLIQGRDDTDSTIEPGSYQYGYLGGSAHTAEGATPQTVENSYTRATGLSRTAESSVWTFDATSGALSPHWVNPSGSVATTLTFAQSTALYFGGDVAMFNARYPAPVTDVHYVFVPI